MQGPAYRRYLITIAGTSVHSLPFISMELYQAEKGLAFVSRDWIMKGSSHGVFIFFKKEKETNR